MNQTKKDSPAWVFVENTADGKYRMFCQRCGGDYIPTLPVSIPMFVAQVEAFTADHATCLLKESHEPQP